VSISVGKPMKLLIASANVEKRRELEALLAGLGVEVLALSRFPGAPEVVEDGVTFEANACKKAREMAIYSGLHTMADDSGLCVDALGGRPGVMSSRYAGPNPTTQKLCSKLLKEMESVPEELRGATFHCFTAMANPTGRILFIATGCCRGKITRVMRGRHGFGYDPVFLYEPAGKTFAEMEPEEKNAVSHRGRALRAFRARFMGLFST